MKAVSIFSGAGGMDLGFARAGLPAEVAVEMMAEACATLRANFPSATVLDTRVEAVDWDALSLMYGPFDVVYGGPPCQPFSGAGKGVGEYDPRDGFPAAREVIRRLRPRAFVFENVRGLLFKKHSEYLAAVRRDLVDLGYSIDVRLLNAADYGVPQHRERTFIVGLRADVVGRFRWPAPSHGGGLFAEPWVTVREALGLGGALHVTRGESSPRRDHPVDEPSPTVVANMATGGNAGGSLRHVPEVSAETAEKSRRLIADVDEPARTILAANRDASGKLGGGNAPYLCERATVRRKRGASQERPDSSIDDPSPAVLADAPSGGSGLYLTDQYPNSEAHSPTYSGDRPSRTVTRIPQGVRLASDETLRRHPGMDPDMTGWVEAKREQRTFTLDELKAKIRPRTGGGLRKGERILGDAPAPAQLAAPGGRDFVPVELPIYDAPSTTINGDPRMSVAGHHGPMKGASSQFTSKAGVRYRRLTWEECAALQAFPPDYVFVGASTKKYLQIGNAVPPPLAEVIARSLLEALAA